MHELSVVFHIAKVVEDIAKENNVARVSKVVLEVGEVSMIVNPYLQDCWKWKASKSEVLKDCELEIINIKAVTYCEDCKQQYETVKHGKICPFCGSNRTYLLRGNETNIKEIVVFDK